MMGTFFLNNSISTTPNSLAKTTRSDFTCTICCMDGYSSLINKTILNNKKNILCCLSSGNVKTINGLPSILSERSLPTPTMASTDHSSGVINAGNLVLSSSNGTTKTQEDVGAIGLSSHSATNKNNSIEFPDQGIGIVRFLKGKCLLITGGTGFLGKVLIEKILRTVPDVAKIYLLIKAKSKEEAVERLRNEIMSKELFKCLQQIHGESYQTFMLSKLVPVLGNITEANLGIEQELADEVSDEVDIILNSAANTTFDERYDVALDINTQGPHRLMTFAKRCHKLQLFLQVSTAYVNGQRQGRIMEKPFFTGESIARERISSETLACSNIPMLDVESEINLALQSRMAFCQENVATQKMKELGFERAKIFGWQDTYVFTKAMGEMMIDNMRGDIPVAIVRPSVIESTYKEPFPGWMEGNRMMDPIISYYGKGQLTGFLVDSKGVLDVVPADMVVNATLAAIAKHGEAGKPGINIYQIASSVVNPLVYEDLAKLLFEHFKSSPYMDSRGRPIDVQKMKLFDSMCDFSSHIWTDAIEQSERVFAPASASYGKLSKRLDNICRKYVEQAKYLANIYEPYTFYGGRFDNTNTENLMEEMSEEEKRSFGFDVGSIDWKDYISNVHIPGLRRHVMKGRGSSCL